MFSTFLRNKGPCSLSVASMCMVKPNRLLVLVAVGALLVGCVEETPFEAFEKE